MSGLTVACGGPMMPVVAKPGSGWRDTTLGPAVQAYLDHLRKRRLSASTVKNREALLSCVCELLDGYTLPDLSGKQGRQVLETRLVDGAWRDVQASSLSTYISTLKAFFAWAYDEELLLHDPARRIDMPKQRERQYSLFTVDEEQALLGAQPFTRDRVALMLHFEFAMRATDLRLLQLGDIDLGRRTVRLRNGKGGTDRTLSFRTPDVFETVTAYLTLDRAGGPDEFLLYPMRAYLRGTYRPGLVLPAEQNGGEPFREPVGDGYWTELLELGPTGSRRGGRLDPFSPSGLRYWWRRCLDRAGLPRRRLHDARHTTGTRMVGSGKNFRTVSKFLRHANLNTTELYVHLNELETMRDELWEDK